MFLSQEIENKFNSAQTILEKVHIIMEDANSSEVIYNKISENIVTIDDIALIQSFYGTDIARIRATTTALEFNLQMTSRPSSWVFVECQKKKSDAAFGWVARYGIKYKFIQMSDENDGLMLKTPLWNIGTTLCHESKLCFLDSDVVMCNSDWIEKCNDSFIEGDDVISLASQHYEELHPENGLKQTIGYVWSKFRTVKDGHCGFSIGLTRNAFETLHGFDATIILDDAQTYERIFGFKEFKPFEKWCLNPNDENYGLNIQIGYADNVACHVWHGDASDKYHQILSLMKFSGAKSYSDIISYDKTNYSKLPTWKNCSNRSKSIAETIKKYLKTLMIQDETNRPTFDPIDEYIQQMIKNCGEIESRKNTLYICSIVKDGFNVGLNEFIQFRTGIENAFKKYNINPIVVFFTDCRKYDFKANELNVIPLKNYDKNNAVKQLQRKDLKISKSSVLYYVPFDYGDFNKLNTRIWIPDERIENEDGTILLHN